VLGIIFFLLEGHHLELSKTFCCQSSPKYKNGVQILDGAADLM
jgi:hypothetical protein